MDRTTTIASSSPRAARRLRGRTAARLSAALLVTVGAAACGGGGGQAAPAPSPQQAAAANLPWPVKTRAHLDLWLHGFAMITNDTARVPYFRRGYRDQMTVRKNQVNVTSMLDANRQQLEGRLASNRALVNAQFLALYFGNWSDMRQAIEGFLRVEGDPRRTSNAELQQVFAFLARQFPTAPDREWLRLFTLSLEDERQKFYESYWTAEQRTRAAALAAVDSLWQQVYRPRLQGFLNNTQQETGDIFLSLPLDGEGRTVTAGSRDNVIATTFPDTPGNAIEAIYVIAHEAVGPIANTAVSDHTTPAEKREGTADRLSSAALVRGGALVLARMAPELVDGYARFYLRTAGQPATGAPRDALAAAFPLPPAIQDAIARQIDVVLGGI